MPGEKNQEKLLNYNEAAELLRIHPCSLRRLVSQGKINYIKIGQSVRFLKSFLIDENIRKAG